MQAWPSAEYVQTVSTVAPAGEEERGGGSGSQICLLTLKINFNLAQKMTWSTNSWFSAIALPGAFINSFWSSNFAFFTLASGSASHIFLLQRPPPFAATCHLACSGHLACPGFPVPIPRHRTVRRRQRRLRQPIRSLRPKCELTASGEGATVHTVRRGGGVESAAIASTATGGISVKTGGSCISAFTLMQLPPVFTLCVPRREHLRARPLLHDNKLDIICERAVPV